MGITALFVIVLIISLFLVSYIPKLSLGKKILIVISTLLVCFAILAFLFATQFGKRKPQQENNSQEIIK